MAILESGTGGGSKATVDATPLALRVVPRPIISATLGEYQCSLYCQPVAAQATGVRASFRYAGANLCLVEKIIFDGAGVSTAALTAGQALAWQVFVHRAYTVGHVTGTATAATLTGNNCKLRTSYSTTQVADIRIATTATALTGNTSTPDAQPLGQASGALVTLGDKLNEYAMFDQYQVGHPLICAQNEGFTINMPIASPAAGAIGWGFTVKWTEVTAAEWA